MDKDKKETETDSHSKKRRKQALGRGLEALIPGIEGADDNPKDYFLCDIALIRPNPYQPRRRFSEDDLHELSESIQAQGMLQPLLVRTAGEGYELIAGERRLRAAKMAGLGQAPVVVKNISDSRLLEASLVENIQRADLNPVEEAEAYHRLMTEFGMTQDQVAGRVGKSRSAVANFLRLRQLPQAVRDTVMDGTLSMGHARALLGADAPAIQKTAWRTVMKKKLSVRETESLVKRLNAEAKIPEPAPPTSEDIHFTHLSDDMSRRLGAKVHIRRRGKKGKLEIEFLSHEDLDRLLTLLGFN